MTRIRTLYIGRGSFTLQLECGHVQHVDWWQHRPWQFHPATRMRARAARRLVAFHPPAWLELRLPGLPRGGGPGARGAVHIGGAGAAAVLAMDAADGAGGVVSHTPGPWRLQSIHLRGSTAYNIEPNIARIPSGLQPQSETDANARLLVAAPDLLDALKDCRDELFKRIDRLTADMPDDVRQKYLQFPPVVKADAAIAKVEGRQP